MKTKLFILAAALFTFTIAGCAAGTASGSVDDGTELPEEEVFAPEGDEESGAEDAVEEDSTEEEELTVKYVSVLSDGVNIRSGAGTSYSVNGSAEKNTMYAYVGEQGDWYKIRYKNSYSYISKKYTQLTEMTASDDEVVERVIEEGTKYLGTTYVYGAVRYHDGKGNKLKNFTTEAFDCSSLMQYIFYMGADVLLDVTTRTQVVQGTTVARSQLSRGDLMFFTNSSRYNKTGVERIGHVALYLGDNLILHTASDYAKIEEISSTRWGYYVQTQRMV